MRKKKLPKARQYTNVNYKRNKPLAKKRLEGTVGGTGKTPTELKNHQRKLKAEAAARRKNK
jgi:hypothetical protein